MNANHSPKIFSALLDSGQFFVRQLGLVGLFILARYTTGFHARILVSGLFIQKSQSTPNMPRPRLEDVNCYEPNCAANHLHPLGHHFLNQSIPPETVLGSLQSDRLLEHSGSSPSCQIPCLTVPSAALKVPCPSKRSSLNVPT